MKLFVNHAPKEAYDILLKIGQTDIQASGGFALAGGTNLALRTGHRLSVDLDFFCKEAFSVEELERRVKTAFPRYIKTDQSKEHLRLLVDSVKIEFIRHDYPYLQNIETIQDIRLYSLPDLAAMKLNATVNRGSKKDFFDIAELLKTYQITQLLSFFSAKYSNTDRALALRALSYFDDAENEPEPLKVNTTWPKVKQTISEAIRQVLL